MLALEGILVMNDLKGTKEYRNRERACKEQCSESRVPVPSKDIYKHARVLQETKALC